MVEAPSSIADVLDTAVAMLEAAGVEEPRREVLRLWSALERTSTAALLLQRSAPVGPDRVRQVFGAVERRAQGEPLAYVTGATGFRRLMLHCDRRALIPRPETEGLVEAALRHVRTGTAADIGTGTGALALALRDEGAFDEVIGVDISSDALALAAENAAGTGLAVTWFQGDLVAPLLGREVDLLVSNPPYLTQHEHDTLDRSVRDYEPALALIAGDDGLAITRRLLGVAQDVVTRGGWIALEIDCRRAQETGRIAATAGWQDVMVLDDLFGRARYLLARRGSTT